MKLIGFAAFLIFSTSAYSAGPTSFGPIKIGMTKVAVESLNQGQEFKLIGPLEPLKANDNESIIPGVEKYSGIIAVPSGGGELKTEFGFKEGLLNYFHVSLDGEAALDNLHKQISEKYGPPKVSDKIKEEQCIYKNGANFKIRKGYLTNEWSSATGTGNVIATLSKFVMAFCPSNLRYGSVGEKVFYSLRISAAEKQEAKVEKNLF